MKTHNLLIISTAHLHPLEAKEIDKSAYISSPECSMVSTDPSMIQYYTTAFLVCMVELLQKLKENYNADYVIFDADADIIEGMKTYDW